MRLIAARPDVFYRQGHVAAGYRRRNGKTFGPYYRLGYRLDGRQYSIYLGRSEKLVEQVRKALAAIQKPLAQRRLFNQLERQIRASLRVQKLRIGSLLRPFGLRLKGFEVRGWRYSPLRRFLPRRGGRCGGFRCQPPPAAMEAADCHPRAGPKLCRERPARRAVAAVSRRPRRPAGV